MSLAVPAQADEADPFLDALSSAGIDGIDPAVATDVGQSVCPMLAEPGQDLANVASDVSESIGQPLGASTMFTGVAISMFCPTALSSVANGDVSLPLDLLGAFT